VGKCLKNTPKKTKTKTKIPQAYKFNQIDPNKLKKNSKMMSYIGDF
jgi:hypothetical protein